ncbi:MAG: hypothetical protein BAJALOKI1v1_180016 [Promethearchaeota archaeon]|nr:MAG: hypothetical protein BAJALOKI1v1_180016 [Candidatus Lokiarchaeota archaeon]
MVNLYSCSNKNCAMSKIVFNQSPRFDYSDRHFGADVFRFISNEFLLFSAKPSQIIKNTPISTNYWRFFLYIYFLF